MDGRLEYVCDFRTSKELESFFKEKQNDVSFSFSKPGVFDGEFLPLFCFSHFFSPRALFRLVRHENTIRDAEMKLPDGAVTGIQITQATSAEQMRDHNHKDPAALLSALEENSKCAPEEVSVAAERVLHSLESKFERYKLLPDYKADETLLLIYLNDPSTLSCFEPNDLLSALKERVPQDHLNFFAEIHVIYLRQGNTWSLVNLTTLETKSTEISLSQS